MKRTVQANGNLLLVKLNHRYLVSEWWRSRFYRGEKVDIRFNSEGLPFIQTLDGRDILEIHWRQMDAKLIGDNTCSSDMVPRSLPWFS
jgi:hypothetical protein